jgi:hypothetical protein
MSVDKYFLDCSRIEHLLTTDGVTSPGENSLGQRWRLYQPPLAASIASYRGHCANRVRSNRPELDTKLHMGPSVASTYIAPGQLPWALLPLPSSPAGRPKNGP